MSIAKVVENIETMQKLFEASGFKQVRLFKGFSEVDEKTFYLVGALSPGEEEKDYLLCVRKARQLEKELQDLLGCFVSVSRESSMEPDCLESINMTGNSVNLSNPIEKLKLQEELENYFGADWQFNKIDPYTKFDPYAEDWSEGFISQGSYKTIIPPNNLFAPLIIKEETSAQKIENIVAQLSKLKDELTNPEWDLLMEKVSNLGKPQPKQCK